jgi:hypothetical protein
MTGPTKKALGIAEYQGRLKSRLLRLAQKIFLVRFKRRSCPVNGIELDTSRIGITLRALAPSKLGRIHNIDAGKLASFQ